MLLADDFAALVAHGLAEGEVRLHDGSIGFELDHRDGTVERVEDVLVMKRGDLGGGDVRRNFHDTGHAATLEDRVVGGFDPDVLAGLGNAPELPALWLSGGQIPPELDVLGRLGHAAFEKHSMVLADDLVKGIAECLAEIGVSARDDTIGRKPDDRVRVGNCGVLLNNAMVHKREFEHGHSSSLPYALPPTLPIGDMRPATIC